MANASSVWEDRIVLVESNDEDQARRVAEDLGKKEIVSYQNCYGEQVLWQFDSVDSVYKIGPDLPGNMSELFSRFLKDSEVKSLKQKFSD